MSPTNSLIIDLTIDSLSYFGGRGVGRYDGIVVFVPGTAPGDRVRVRITAQKPKFWEAELVEILEPSRFRREPPCPVADRCGGCSWQHVDYAQQLVQKQKILSDSLRKLQKRRAFEMRELIAAPSEFYYRNRVQVHIENGRVGFFAKGSRELVAIERCWLVEPELNEKIAQLKTEVSSSQRLEISSRRDHDPAAFAQVNSAQNEKLKALVVDSVNGAPDWILDLYSGAGNFTFPLRAKFQDTQITAVELSEKAVAHGRGKSQGDSRMEWMAGDVARVLKRLTKKTGAGLILLDPPRDGCSKEVIAEMKRLAPRQILYVSCNPMTFARDAERLLSDETYRLEWIQGLDMFPQTEHVELVASFQFC